MNAARLSLARLSFRATATTSSVSASASGPSPPAAAARFTSSSTTSTPIPTASSLRPAAAASISKPASKSTSLLRTLNLQLAASSPNAHLLPLFDRRSKERLLPGSILTVSSYSSPPTPENPNPSINTFSGVLIAIRRRHAGVDTSFRLRNLIGRTGVEVAYKVCSPLVKDVKVVSRATTSGVPVINAAGQEVSRKKPVLRAERRAKLYFVRDQPHRLTSVAGIVKQAKEREQQASAAADKRRR